MHLICVDVSSIIKWPVATVISDVHSIAEEPAPPFHKALIMMYNHRWSFRGTVRDSDHALHWLYIKIVMKVILRHRQGFWSCFTLIWYKICNEIHFAAPSGIIHIIHTTKKTNEIGHFAAPSGIQMMFSIDFDEKIVMKKICGAVRDNPPDDTAKIPDGAVALTQSEELKFLAGINHNTPFIFSHHININVWYVDSLQGIALGLFSLMTYSHRFFFLFILTCLRKELRM